MIGIPGEEYGSHRDRGQEHRSPYFPEGLVMDNVSKCPVSGKRKYATEGAALATAKHQVATADASMELRAYRCNWCNAWHLTKKTEKTGKHRS